jgi:hypothetical protein
VLVPVPLVGRVTVTVVHVVDVVFVWDRDMAAAGSVLVRVCVMHDVFFAFALVDVTIVGSVEMTVVHVVDVVFVRDRHMAAAGSVVMRMVGMRVMFCRGRHGRLPQCSDGASPAGYQGNQECSGAEQRLLTKEYIIILLSMHELRWPPRVRHVAVIAAGRSCPIAGPEAACQP